MAADAVSSEIHAELALLGIGTISSVRIAVHSGGPGWHERILAAIVVSASDLGWMVVRRPDATLVMSDLDGRRLGTVQVLPTPAGCVIRVRSRAMALGRMLPAAAGLAGVLAGLAAIACGLVEPLVGIALAAAAGMLGAGLGVVLGGIVVSQDPGAGSRAFIDWAGRLPAVLRSSS